MRLKLLRYHHGSDDTLGLLFAGEEFLCFTLEDEYRSEKVRGETRIPEGIYKVGLRHSPKFSHRYGHEMLHIMGVPGFEYILIHTGNTEKDTEGCLLVGDAAQFIAGGKSAIGSSISAYRRIYPLIAEKIKAGDDVTINIGYLEITW